MRRLVVFELIANVAIPILAPRCRDANGSNVDLLCLWCVSVIPLGTTEWTSNVVTHLCSSPLVEACFVDVVATSSAAPHNLLVILELHAANRTIVFDRLAVAIHRLVFCDLPRQSWRIAEHLLELGGEEGVLLLQAIWRFEDVVEDVQRMLAQLLLVLLVEDADWASAAWDM